MKWDRKTSSWLCWCWSDEERTRGEWQVWESEASKSAAQPKKPVIAWSPGTTRAGSVVSDVTTTATLPLSKDEEKEARKLEAELRKIESLQARKADGESLSPWEEVQIRRKPQIDYAPVMVKVLNGAERCALDTDPLSKDEEKEVRKMERRLRAIRSLEERKADGDWLENSEMAEIRRKSKILSDPLMVKVRKGAARCALDEAPQNEQLAAPSPVMAPARAPDPPAPVAVAPREPQRALGEQPQREPLAAPAEVQSTEPQGPSLNWMVTSIRDELGLEESLTMAQVIAEANHQSGLPETGSLRQQASLLFHQLCSA